MAHPVTHAESSAKKYGGEPKDYLPIHNFMDSSKAVFSDNRHRALTHNSWFIFIVEKVFGEEIELSNGKKAKTRYICEQHILEDFGNKFIPTASDWLENIEFQPWMNNAIEGAPSSHKKLENTGQKRERLAFLLD